MNRWTVRPEQVAGGALIVGGLLVILLPQHSLTVLRLVIVSAAAGIAIHALALTAPRMWWTSPFDRTRKPRPDVPAASELAALRTALSGRRQPLADGPPLPAETLRVLRPLIEVAAARGGLDLHDSAQGAGLSDLTRAVYRSDPLIWPRWHRTRRPSPYRVADAVLRVLDDLDRLAARTGGAPRPDSQGA